MPRRKVKHPRKVAVIVRFSEKEIKVIRRYQKKKKSASLSPIIREAILHEIQESKK